MQWNVVRAVFARNFISYFSNPIGYLFITAFVWGCAYFAFWHNDAFFASNLADLEQLNTFFPYLLLFFIPAITMSTWADERRSGTEELLLTLPASDLEIVLGKYSANLAIYTVSLIFSSSNVLVLAYLGDPDIGLMFSTFLGYWLIGAALLAVGMIGSLLTTGVTVAFIVGAGLCLLLVSSDELAVIFARNSLLREMIEKVGVIHQFDDFGKGLVPISGLLYFAAIIVVAIYVNMLLLSRRHWAGSEGALLQWTHGLVRSGALALAAVGLVLLVSRVGTYARADVTEERIHSLSQDTKKVLAEIPSNKPVFVEAFVSPASMIPTAYVETYRDLIDLLRQYDARGGSNLHVRIIETEPFSEEARDAERNFGIQPEAVVVEDDGRFAQENLFLGIACRSGLNERTIPFFFRGLPIEYELTRLIRTVTDEAKRKVGVLTTDAGLFGQFNFQSMQPPADWQIVQELRQQYDVVQVSPAEPIVAEIDCLIVPMASSLTQPEMMNLIAYVSAGKPALILDDPVPFINPDLAPREPKRPANSPMMGRQPPAQMKADLTQLTKLLNIEFDTGRIIWQDWNPHPQFKDLPPEYVFIGSGSGGGAFNEEIPITDGLQEVLMLYPGAIRPGPAKSPTFDPLLTTGLLTGTIRYSDAFTRSLLGRVPNPNPRRTPTRTEYVLAAYITGPLATTAKSQTPGNAKDQKSPEGGAEANVIWVGDLDMISDFFFDLRRARIEQQDDIQFDNVTFILNCVDFLAGDESFVELRKRRPKRRTLDRLVEMTQSVRQESRQEELKAEENSQKQLDEAQRRLDESVQKIRNRTDIDARSKAVLIENARRTEQRRLDVLKAEIEDQKAGRIRQIRADLQRQLRAEQRGIKLAAVLLPPIPALVLGLIVFLARLRGEREGVDPKRLVG
ncbi:ABC-type uncharacterized transport system [Planctomycetes bacterium Pan216]|uniref:ABC-type uncharacterized transport system n=1 Tax=Kolteria novifilia TaxID=2527975 RepID=A0A518B532_9BACT|nr:ABC-type uncharacterized transport system [Planctomycetes bacterium Pan216]